MVEPAPPPRRIEVAVDRADGWVRDFARAHGRLSRSIHPSTGALTVCAADGSRAVLHGFTPGPLELPRPTSTPLSFSMRPPERIALILVRRGGYGIGVGNGAALSSHKTGSRYVQSRTAAGGWSQQRYARRRENQADALVKAVADHAAALVAMDTAQAVVTGGDRALTTAVLRDSRLRRLTTLPRRDLPDLGNPNLVLLRTALKRGRAVRIDLTEPDRPLAVELPGPDDRLSPDFLGLSPIRKD